VDAVVSPEPPEEEREALLAAVAEPEARPWEGAWTAAARSEATESDEP